MRFKASGGETSSLSMYDIVGRQVDNLWEGIGIPGIREFTLERGSLPSGLYFLLLLSGGFALSERVILFDR